MTKLWLNYKDETGEEQRIPVEVDKFRIGRHSNSDLSIIDSRLSREHAELELVDGSYLLKDNGSFNGTKLNGEEVINALPVLNGDKIDLGGLILTAEYAEEVPDDPEPAIGEVPEVEATTASATAEAAPKKKGIPMVVLLMIPMFAIVILLFAGVLLYLWSTRDKNTPPPLVVQEQNDPMDDPLDDDREKPPKTPTGQQTGQTDQGGPDGPSGDDMVPPPTVSPTAVVEASGAKFLRSIAQNDPRAFLTSEQAKRVDGKAKQFKGSASLAQNIAAAKKSAKEIGSIASANNLKPQFLAVAAIASFGNSRGDIVAASRKMAEVFGKLEPQIGTERSDDALLMVAAYDQGANGDTMKLRNMLQELAKNNPESSREIRSIWYLEKDGKITKNEFERALTFLAIGTITQNPKEFDVNAEALSL